MAKRGPKFVPNKIRVVDDVVWMTLTRGQEACVDLCDYPLVSQYRWCAHQPKGNKTMYAVAHSRNADGRIVQLLMHKVLLGLGFGDNRRSDHKDWNGLNNCRDNIRIATVSQNGQNSRRFKKSSSKYRGVYYASSRPELKKRWVAQIACDGKERRLGHYLTEREAAEAYNSAARELHGEFAILNAVE